jgi:hypothetical protein
METGPAVLTWTAGPRYFKSRGSAAGDRQFREVEKGFAEARAATSHNTMVVSMYSRRSGLPGRLPG